MPKDRGVTLELTLEFILIQLLGLIPSVIAFTSLQSGSRSRILSLQILCCVLWVVHYALLGVSSGIVINIIGLFRAVICSFNDRKWASSRLWLVFFLAAYAASPLLGWDGPYCLLLAAAMMLTSVALWSHNMRLTRLLYLCNSPLALAYNVFAGSYSSIIIEICALISFVIAVWRFDIRPARQNIQT